MEIRECAIIKINDAEISQTMIDEVFSPEESDRFMKNHPVGEQADKFIARDAGDSLIFVKDGMYKFWDSISNEIYVLGSQPLEFVVGYEE